MKTLKILEVMWFSISIAFISVGIFQFSTKSLTESIGYFIIALMAFAIGFARRKQRTKAETENGEL